MIEEPKENPNEPPTWTQRHAASILSAFLVGLLGLVILVQVGC